jgi:hypothetical protein
MWALEGLSAGLGSGGGIGRIIKTVIASESEATQLAVVVKTQSSQYV